MDKGKTIHMGYERRREARRTEADRRDEIRFELDKDDRRQHSGRREGDHDPWRDK